MVKILVFTRHSSRADVYSFTLTHYFGQFLKTSSLRGEASFEAYRLTHGPIFVLILKGQDFGGHNITKISLG